MMKKIAGKPREKYQLRGRGMIVSFRWSLVGLFACMLVAGRAAALETPEKYFAMNGYFVSADDARGVQADGSGIDLILGRQIRQHLYAELRGFGVLFDKNNQGAEVYTNVGVGLDLHYLLGRRGSFSAMLLGGAGFVFNDVDTVGQDAGGIQANIGLGLLSRGLTSSKIRLRLEARSMYEDYLDGVNDYRIGLGFEIPLDPTEIVVREVPVEKAIPAPVPPPNLNYPPKPIDSDGDGVLDNFDACKGTLPGTRVDRSGCAVKEQNLRLEGVYFESNSDRLKPESAAGLERAVQALQGQPTLHVLIAGHADKSGNSAHNKRLSQQRAEAVMQYLRDRGIAAERMTARGYGDERPVASNDTPEGRKLNRRVELQLAK